ncbi:MAG: PIN domain-containing protein [Deltaproteobacteria bacterium]|nr:PIN domain-containing protein [Deltaproteobacteria bacterium]
MSRVLVDSSVWIDYFSSGRNSEALSGLISHNRICINDIILAELIPSLMIKKENDIIALLHVIEKVKFDIDWSSIIDMQTANLKNGINRVGIADLLVLQNALQNDLVVYSLDKHFRLMQKLFKFNML